MGQLTPELADAIDKTLSGEISFEDFVQITLKYSQDLHPPIRSLHEGLAIILEEYMEFQQEVFKKKPDPVHVMAELGSVAAMCQRLAEDQLLKKE